MTSCPKLYLNISSSYPVRNPAKYSLRVLWQSTCNSSTSKAKDGFCFQRRGVCPRLGCRPAGKSHPSVLPAQGGHLQPLRLTVSVSPPVPAAALWEHSHRISASRGTWVMSQQRVINSSKDSKCLFPAPSLNNRRGGFQKEQPHPCSSAGARAS